MATTQLLEPVVIVLALSVHAWPGRYSRGRTLLPGEFGAPACTRIFPIRPTDDERRSTTSAEQIAEFDAIASEESTLGPCAYRAAFGVPGAGMAAHLANTHYAFLRRPPQFTGTSRAGSTFLPRTDDHLQPVHAGTWDCARRARPCLALLDQPPSVHAWLDRGHAIPASLDAVDPPLNLISTNGDLIARLCESVGRAGCARVWSSSELPSVAFAKIGGGSMDSMVRTWVQQRLKWAKVPYASTPVRGAYACLAFIAVLAVLAVCFGRLRELR